MFAREKTANFMMSKLSVLVAVELFACMLIAVMKMAKIFKYFFSVSLRLCG